MPCSRNCSPCRSPELLSLLAVCVGLSVTAIASREDEAPAALLARAVALDMRSGGRIDLQRVVRHARERGCFIELNSQPDRLDLIDTACQMAKAEGVLVSLDTDAHSGLELDFVRFGVGQARRGWLEKADVLNTRELDELRPLLARTM